MNILITGANSGMGLETAKALARQGHRLILTVRNSQRAEELKQSFPEPGRIIGIHEVDLGSFASIYRGASSIFQHNLNIDVLFFNAGIMTPPWAQTENGFEVQFQSNYLGHFYLFSLLQDRLLASEHKRVISISSLSSEKGACKTLNDFEAVARVNQEDYDPMKSYRESKLAQVLFSRELHARFAEQGLLSASVHPGIVNTNLFYRQGSSFYKAAMQPLAWLGYLTGILSTPKTGAKTALDLSTGPSFLGGLYWAKSKPRTHHPLADDSEFCRNFWDWSLNLLPAGIP